MFHAFVFPFVLFQLTMDIVLEIEKPFAAGLVNQGATCYMNALLQNFYHIPNFRKVSYLSSTVFFFSLCFFFHHLFDFDFYY